MPILWMVPYYYTVQDGKWFFLVKTEKAERGCACAAAGSPVGQVRIFRDQPVPIALILSLLWPNGCVGYFLRVVFPGELYSVVTAAAKNRDQRGRKKHACVRIDVPTTAPREW